MTELRQINKQDFLQELKYRVENEEITEEEWKKGYELAAKDKEREKEVETWENTPFKNYKNKK